MTYTHLLTESKNHADRLLVATSGVLFSYVLGDGTIKQAGAIAVFGGAAIYEGYKYVQRKREVKELLKSMTASTQASENTATQGQEITNSTGPQPP